MLTNAPILAYPDFKKPFVLTTDASNVAIGSVLTQANHPLSYYSRTLNSAERNYSTIEKELLAIVDSTKHFRPYLFGQKFVIETDHNPLVWLSKLKEPNSRLIRWKLKLEEFDFSIIYRKGKENHVADSLSRIEINMNETDESIEPNIEENPHMSDEELDDILNALGPSSNPQPMETNEPRDNGNDSLATVHSTNDDDGKAIPITEKPVNMYHNRIILKLGDTYKRKLIRPFNRMTHIVTIDSENIENNIATFLKKFLYPTAFTECTYKMKNSVNPLWICVKIHLTQP